MNNPLVITSIITLVGTLCGTFGGILTSYKLVAYRIEQLEKKQDKHNQVIERVYLLEKRDSIIEEQLKSINSKIDRLGG